MYLKTDLGYKCILQSLEQPLEHMDTHKYDTRVKIGEKMESH
jgi:hypothetical protein